VELTDRSVPALTDLAFAWVGRGDPKKALTCFEEVLEAEPDNLVAWMNIGLICQEKLSDPERAIRAYEEYQKRGGEDERVEKWLNELRKNR
jgi:tetratricopeptide (TPR) repeat protein